MTEQEHFVQFYEADAFLFDSVGAFLLPALQSGTAVVVVAAGDHRRGIEAKLGDAGIDLEVQQAAGRYIFLDARATLDQFMDSGMPHSERFREVIGAILDRAADGRRPVSVFGEMVALLAADDNHAAAVRLEQLWNDLAATRRFTLLCGYPAAVFSDESLTAAFAAVCDQHGRVIPTESYTALTSPDAQSRAVALWQQKARRLEAEVAERERAEERLAIALAAERKARQAAEDALRKRDEFVSIAAHELKTPVTSLQGFAQLLHRRLDRGDTLDPAWISRAVRDIAGQAGRLTRLVNQLLDVTRLEAGKLGLQLETADLNGLVEQAAANAGARTVRHTFVVSAPQRIHAAVDPLRLEQVLTNLLENAIKYSPEGGAVEVSLRRTGDAVLEIAVRDHGPGIPADRRAHLFERFFQAHDGHHGAGLGLGLYVSKQIVEMHGGQIWAEFPEDGGTCFVFSLPLQTAASSAELVSQTA